MTSKTVMWAGAALMLSTLACDSATAKSWKFNVVNKSQTSVVEFRTREDGEWSRNWIRERIEPGDTFEMDFNTDEGDCTIRTQMRLTDGRYFDGDIDYCKVSTIYVSEQRISWD